MKQKRPRAFTNEPQQAGRQGLDSWAAGGEYLLQFPISRKPAFFSTPPVPHTLAAGLPDASLRPMPVKGRISRRRPPGGHRKPLAWVPAPCAGTRQTGLCVPGAG